MIKKIYYHIQMMIFLIIFILIFGFSLLMVENVDSSGLPENFSFYNTEFDENKLTVRYLYLKYDDEKLGTGDSILIKSPEGKTMLIDSGLPEVAPLIIKNLHRLGVDTIDYAIATHPHTDHIGGFPNIFREFEIKNVYTIDLIEEGGTYENFINSIKNLDLDLTYLNRGDTFEFGDEVTVEILNPKIDNKIRKHLSGTKDNNLSLVMKMNYEDQTFLFTGDIYTTAQQELVDIFGDDLNSDFLDVPHHGYLSTGQVSSFIKAVNPKYVAISNKNFDHIDTYKKYQNIGGAKVFVTRFDGNILLAADGDEINYMGVDYTDRPALLHERSLVSGIPEYIPHKIIHRTLPRVNESEIKIVDWSTGTSDITLDVVKKSDSITLSWLQDISEAQSYADVIIKKALKQATKKYNSEENYNAYVDPDFQNINKGEWEKVGYETEKEAALGLLSRMALTLEKAPSPEPDVLKNSLYSSDFFKKNISEDFRYQIIERYFEKDNSYLYYSDDPEKETNNFSKKQINTYRYPGSVIWVNEVTVELENNEYTFVIKTPEGESESFEISND